LFILTYTFSSNLAKVDPPLSFSTLAIVVPSLSYSTLALIPLFHILFILSYNCSTC
jgi:hypothetical protein